MLVPKHVAVLWSFVLVAMAILFFTLFLFMPTANANTTDLNAARGGVAALVINEVDADTPGTDIAEFIELYDGGVGNTALDGVTLVLYNGSNDLSYETIALDGHTTDANGYFVVGDEGVNGAAITLTVSIQQGADAVALYQSDAANFSDGTALTTVNLLDALVYDTNDEDDAELLTLLNAGQPQVNEAADGSAADHSNQRCANGSGGQRNTATYMQIPPSPGAANNCAAVAPTITPTPTTSVTPEVGILINEVDADTPSTDTAEFVEFYDGGTGNTPLDGLTLVFYDGADDEAYLALDLDGLTTNADGYLVVGNSAVASAPITFANGRLQNGADAVALYVGNAADFPANTAVTTANLLDALVYGTDDDDDDGLLPLLLAGGQMNEAGANNPDAVAMGRCPNGSGGQRNSAPFALISPSPNEPNNCGSPLPTFTPTATPSAPTATPTATATATLDNATPTATPVAPAVLINELDADSDSFDNAEFIELSGAPGTTLELLCLVGINGTNDRVYFSEALTGATLDQAGLYVIGNAAVANVDLIIPDATLQNGADAVALIATADCGATISSSTTVTDLLGMTLVDALVYGTNDDADPDLLQLLHAGQPQVNEDGGGDSGLHANSRCPSGGGEARNSSGFVQVAPSPGVANDCSSFATPTATATAMATATPTATATVVATTTPTATVMATATPAATATVTDRTDTAMDIYLPVIRR